MEENIQKIRDSENVYINLLRNMHRVLEYEVLHVLDRDDCRTS